LDLLVIDLSSEVRLYKELQGIGTHRNFILVEEFTRHMMAMPIDPKLPLCTSQPIGTVADVADSERK
jgi:hypothetical protein